MDIIVAVFQGVGNLSSENILLNIASITLSIDWCRYLIIEYVIWSAPGDVSDDSDKEWLSSSIVKGSLYGMALVVLNLIGYFSESSLCHLNLLEYALLFDTEVNNSANIFETCDMSCTISPFGV